MLRNTLRILVPAILLTAWTVAAAQAADFTGKNPEDYDVRILRDTWGVPHIFGKTDPDVAFGLAFAHAEDDFGTIQETLIATRSLGASIGGADAAAIDFVVHLLGIWDDVHAKYESDLSSDTRALCEAYAAGINLYVSQHPDEILIPEVFPTTGKDIVAGFVLKAPFFYGLDRVVFELFGKERRREVSTKTAAADFDAATALAKTGDFFKRGGPTGSNTFSVGPSRTADGSTFLNINSHQPFTGPVAWYEAHLHSEDGWDMVGSLFPGMPVLAHGHNRDLGWAHTVNSPDLADIYVLEMNPENENQYRYDGEWRDLEVSEVRIKVKVSDKSDMTMNIRREVLRSVYGPVLRQDHGVYAIRYAGMGDIRQVEQWYRMNKASSHDEWMDAMRMQSIVSLNAGYADKEGNIFYLYNALLPIRAEGYDWEQYLPGDTSETLWTEFLPFDKLPMVLNPESGFVQNCNSSPFQTTAGADNPDAADFAASFGIETHMTNRAMRAMETLGSDASITWDEFYRYKYDMAYSDESFVSLMCNAIANAPRPEDPLLNQAMDVVREWDLSTDPASRGAALCVMTARAHSNNRGELPEMDVLMSTLKESAQRLQDKHGRIDPEWQDVNRLVRGKTDLGVGGGPDIVHALYGRLDEETGRYVGRAGDTYVLLVDWDADGSVSSRSIHQFGSATLDESSPHYDDQSPLFVRRETKPVWFDEADIRANLEREYRPGKS